MGLRLMLTVSLDPKARVSDIAGIKGDMGYCIVDRRIWRSAGLGS